MGDDVSPRNVLIAPKPCHLGEVSLTGISLPFLWGHEENNSPGTDYCAKDPRKGGHKGYTWEPSGIYIK